MKLTIHLEGKNKTELADGLRAHLALFGDEVTPPRKRGAKAEVEEEETFGEDSEAEEEIETEEETKAATHDQVRAACAAYVKKLIARGQSAEDARSKVKGILKKNFNVKLVDDLEDEQLEKALKVLSA